MATFGGRTVRSFRDTPQFKIALYHLFTKSLTLSKNIGTVFHNLHIVENAVGVPYHLFYLQYNECKISLVPNAFVRADRPTLDNFTAAWESFCNNVSTGRFNQSHAHKAASGDITSIHFVLSRSVTVSWPGSWGPLPEYMLRASVWPCFGYFTYQKTQCIKRILNCLEVEWFSVHYEVTT